MQSESISTDAIVVILTIRVQTNTAIDRCIRVDRPHYLLSITSLDFI